MFSQWNRLSILYSVRNIVETQDEMVSHERATQTEQVQNQNREYRGLRGKYVLKFISSLLLPLMLGIFTVVVTFEQQKVARQQRLEDKTESRLQREQDKNESQSKRDQDWNIAQMGQAAQNKAINDQYQDAVLIAYIKEVGDMLKENKGSLTSDPLTHTLARVKTLNAIRQLDGTRQMYILRFLYEAGQLTNTDESRALDISTAELIDIDFRKFARLLDIREISLAGVYLVNSTFSDIQLRDINLSSAWLGNVNFSSAQFKNAYFSSARLGNVNFSSAQFNNVYFSSAVLSNVKFSSARLGDVDFLSTWLSNVNFSSAELWHVNFSTAEFRDVDFSSTWLFNIDFSSARLRDVNFSSARFGNVDQTYFSTMRFIF